MPDDSTRTVLVALGAGLQVKALVCGIEAGLKGESESVCRVDVVVCLSRAGQFLEQEHERLVRVAGGLAQAHLAGPVGRQVGLRRGLR